MIGSVAALLLLPATQPATAAASGSAARSGPVASVDVDPAAWSAATAYDAGDRVAYADSLWEAGWWTRGQPPGAPDGPWQELRTSPQGDVVWTPSRAFDYGDVVLHEGHRFVAKWHTRNQLPTDPDGPWRLQPGPVPSGEPTEWAAAAEYDTGAFVRHDGRLWQALWWTRQQEPGLLDGPWGEIAFDPDGSVVWTSTRVFDTGDLVVFQGAAYVAKWWTRNQPPGDPDGPWRQEGADPADVPAWTADVVFDAGDVVEHAESRYVATRANLDAEPGDPLGPWSVVPLAVAVTAPPSVAGVVAVGRTVRARPGQWGDPSVTFTYRWFAAGRALERGTDRTYRVPASVRHTRLRVVVTAHLAGAAVGSAASRAVKVRAHHHGRTP